MQEKKVNALMLRAVDYKDNDKILTLLTAEEGKLSAGIKGVKKTGAKLKFAAQPFCFAEYVLAERGGKYTVIQATENESFYELRCDVQRYYAACAVTEAALALSYDGDPCTEIFSAAVHALGRMCGEDEGSALIDYLVTVLGASGYGLGLDNCVECGRDLTGDTKVRFDMKSGSFTCWECGNGLGAHGATYNLLRRCAGKSYKDGLLAEEGKKRALKLLYEYMVFKTDARLLSLSEYINLI